MIFYFTATGNSLEAAQTIAEATHDSLADMGLAFRQGTFGFHVEQGENLGFVFPVNTFTTPALVDEFLRWLCFITPNGNDFVPGYCYCVITCGAFVGNTAGFFAKMLAKYQHIKLDASFSIRNVNNCIILTGPGSTRKQKCLNESAHRTARSIAFQIDSKRMVHAEDRNPLGLVLSVFTGKEHKPSSTRRFSLNRGRCSRCGICWDICPTNVIYQDEDGFPTWEADRCTRCFACLQRCPLEAIQYGTSTTRRQRYTNPILDANPTFTAAIAQSVDMSIPEPEEIIHPINGNDEEEMPPAHETQPAVPGQPDLPA